MTADLINARRDFLQKCGKFAVVTPPTVALMLSAVDRNYAVAASGSSSSGGGNGFVSPFEANVQSGNNFAPGLVSPNTPGQATK